MQDAVQDYARPDSLPEAVRLLAGGGWRVLAGGTDLYPGAGSRLEGRILDLSAVQEMIGITEAGGLRIGAATTWASIASAQLPPGLLAVQQAARQIGGCQIQNAGTLGGNLCNASPAADGVPPLLAVDAKVELHSTAGQRKVALADFLTGPRQTALREGEVLAAVWVPKAALHGRSAFVKLGARSHLVISIAMVAVRLEVALGRIAEMAVAVGSCSAVAQRLPLVEAALRGAPVDAALPRVSSADVNVALSPIDDIRASAAYRRTAATELVRRALAEALA